MTGAQSHGQAGWKLFLRAFAKEIDGHLKTSVRDAWLRRAGAQMAHDLALPPVRTLEELEDNVNAALADLGWGHVGLNFDEPSRLLSIVHTRLPSLEECEGRSASWFPAVLEGLYTGWLGQQPDAGDTRLVARRTVPEQADGSLTLVYGHSKWTEASDLGGASRLSTSLSG